MSPMLFLHRADNLMLWKNTGIEEISSNQWSDADLQPQPV